LAGELPSMARLERARRVEVVGRAAGGPSSTAGCRKDGVCVGVRAAVCSHTGKQRRAGQDYFESADCTDEGVWILQSWEMRPPSEKHSGILTFILRRVTLRKIFRRMEMTQRSTCGICSESSELRMSSQSNSGYISPLEPFTAPQPQNKPGETPTHAGECFCFLAAASRNRVSAPW